MFPPSMDIVWTMFFRGIVYGFLGGFVLIVLFLWSGRYGTLAGARPIAFVYFLVGLETGIALIGGLVFLGLRGWLNYDLRRRALDQSQHGA